MKVKRCIGVTLSAILCELKIIFTLFEFFLVCFKFILDFTNIFREQMSVACSI